MKLPDVNSRSATSTGSSMVKLLGLSFSLSTTSSPSQDFGTLRFNFELHNKWNPVTRQLIECVFVETKQIVGCNSNVILQPALGIAAESKHRALAFYFSNMLQKYPNVEKSRIYVCAWLWDLQREC